MKIAQSMAFVTFLKHGGGLFFFSHLLDLLSHLKDVATCHIAVFSTNTTTNFMFLYF